MGKIFSKETASRTAGRAAANINKSAAATTHPYRHQAQQQQQQQIQNQFRTPQDFKDFQQEQFLKSRNMKYNISQQQQQVEPPTGIGKGVMKKGISPLQQHQQQKQQNQSSSGQEMPDDLLQFLKDTGPLEKKLNTDQTSSRLVETLGGGKSKDEQEKEERKLREQEYARRERRDMRLVKNIDGFTSSKTTNFDTTPEDIVDPVNDFGLMDIEIYQLLKACSTSNKPTAADHDDNYIDEATGEKINTTTNTNSTIQFYDNYINTKLLQQQTQTQTTALTEQLQKSHHEILENTINAIQLPVIVKDIDGEYVGISAQFLEEHGKGIVNYDVVDETRVKLVLADIVDTESKIYDWESKKQQRQRKK